jgi:uncharacterized protein YceK
MKGFVMKKFVLLAVCLAFLPAAAGEEKSPNILDLLKKHTWEIGPQVYHFKYKEPGLMEDTGVFWGLAGAYTYRDWVPTFPEDEPTARVMFRAEGRQSWGTIDYDGALWDGTPYTMSDIDNTSGEWRALLGLDFPKQILMDTIYIGLGYRYLADNGSSDPAGYDRRSRYVYLPVGLKTVRFLSSKWLLSATAEFDLLIRGRQTSHMKRFGYGTVRNEQNSGYGARAAVALEKRGKVADFTIEPFIRYWDIDDSEIERVSPTLGVYEPANKTTEYGVNLIWRF